MGLAGTFARAACRAAAASHQSERGRRRRHAHAVPARSLPRHRSERAAGSGERRRHRALPAVDAGRERDPRAHGDPDARELMAVSRSPAVFVDKDGTLVRDVPYNVDPARIALEEGAAEVVGALAANGFRVIVVSNQPGAALGLFAEPDLEKLGAHLAQLLNGAIEGFYYCPHAPEAG